MNLNVKEIIPLKWDNSKLIPHENSESRYNRDTVLKNYENFDGIFEIILEFDNGDQNVELITNIGITNSFLTAVECLGASLYSPSVLFASITIECILNHDLRLETSRQKAPHKWLDLNSSNLLLAQNEGLPVNSLLENGEQLSNKIKFIERRKKIAHGDTDGYSKIQEKSYTSRSSNSISYTPVSWQPKREDALDQVKKTKNFVEAWGKTFPKLRHH